MCLSAYWQWKLANEQARMFVVTVKKYKLYRDWVILNKKMPASTQVPTKSIHTSTESEFHRCLVSLKRACNLIHTPMLRTKKPYYLKGLKRKGIPMPNPPAPSEVKCCCTTIIMVTMCDTQPPIIAIFFSGKGISTSLNKHWPNGSMH